MMLYLKRFTVEEITEENKVAFFKLLSRVFLIKRNPKNRKKNHLQGVSAYILFQTSRFCFMYIFRILQLCFLCISP